MTIELIHVLSTFSIGLFAGSLLTEGALLVPYWRTLTTEEFYVRHSDFGPRLFRYFFPVTNAAVWLSVISAGLDGFSSSAKNLAMLLCLFAVATFFLYFKKANASFAEQSVPPAALSTELARWNLWHWARTVAVLVAFLCSIVGLN